MTVLGPVTEIPLGEGRTYDVNGEMVAVFRLRDGSVRALSAVCPHRGGPMADGQIDAKVVIYTWHLDPELVRQALDKGAVGCLSKTIEALDLVSALEKVHGGSVVVSDTEPRDALEAVISGGDWPGRDHGLSARESEVLCLIAQGLSNQEIADRAYLSINSVKTYIRSAYRKIRVERRTQAVLWATRNGLVPSKARLILGDP